MEEGMANADEPIRRLAAVGVDLAAATAELQTEGVEKFAEPFDRLLATLTLAVCASPVGPAVAATLHVSDAAPAGRAAGLFPCRFPVAG